jgi:hypothetical protein
VVGSAFYERFHSTHKEASVQQSKGRLLIECVDTDFHNILADCSKLDISLVALLLHLHDPTLRLTERRLAYDRFRDNDIDLSDRIERWKASHASNIIDVKDWGGFATAATASGLRRLDFLMHLRSSEYEASTEGGIDRLRQLAPRAGE